MPRLFRDPKVGKDVRRRTKMWAHDEFNLCALGDIVRTKSARPSCTVARDRGAALRHARARPTCELCDRAVCLQQVRLEPSRALSKKKAHIVAEIIHKENGSTPPTPFPSR